MSQPKPHGSWCLQHSGAAPDCWCGNCHRRWAKRMNFFDQAGWMGWMPHVYRCPDCDEPECPRARGHQSQCQSTTQEVDEEGSTSQ